MSIHRARARHKCIGGLAIYTYVYVQDWTEVMSKRKRENQCESTPGVKSRGFEEKEGKITEELKRKHTSVVGTCVAYEYCISLILSDCG